LSFILIRFAFWVSVIGSALAVPSVGSGSGSAVGSSVCFGSFLLGFGCSDLIFSRVCFRLVSIPFCNSWNSYKIWYKNY
jgi:hypothetical protein